MHRDLKPENVLIYDFDEDLDSVHIKLVDFGFANHIDKKQGAAEQSYDRIGTPAYMAPELVSE